MCYCETLKGLSHLAYVCVRVPLCVCVCVFMHAYCICVSKVWFLYERGENVFT